MDWRRKGNEKSGTTTTTESGQPYKSPLVEDQLLTSTSSGLLGDFADSCAQQLSPDWSASSSSSPPAKRNGSSRSRHCSANSGMSCLSFDSAIGDVYSVQTPPRISTLLDEGLDREFFDLTTASCEAASAAIIRATTPPTSSRHQSSGALLEAAGAPFDIVNLGDDEFGFRLANDTVVDSSGLHVHPAEFGVKKAAAAEEEQSQPTFKTNSSESPPPRSKRRRPSTIIAKAPHTFQAASNAPTPGGAANRFQNHSKFGNVSLPDHDVFSRRQEVEFICLDLLRRYKSAWVACPPPKDQPTTGTSGSSRRAEDPLQVTTHLLSGSLTRLRLFLFNLDPIQWLAWPDRNVLYNHGICTLAVFKASVSLDLKSAPPAFPLPYGEFLGEVEALHLILAHDLYNELRTVLDQVQAIGIRELPVMLLVMMVAFFRTNPLLRQPEKVMRIHDYYMHILQIYLRLRYGPASVCTIVNVLLGTIDKVKSFSNRFHELLCDVSRCGLQKQFESVCENIGLVALMLQSEPSNIFD